MNHIKPITALLILLLAGSCAERKKIKAESVQVKATLIHPFFFQEEVLQLVNFPFWFNDSIIRANKIQTIKHIIFGSALDLDDSNDRIEELPKKTVVYTFNEQGKLTGMQQTIFSEGIIISNQSFKVKQTRNPVFSYIIPAEEHLGMDHSLFMLIPMKRKTNVQQFDNEQYNERYHFITNKKYFGALSVDSIAHPETNDWIILGSPTRPTKKYKVKNKVREYQVSNYHYWNSNFPKQIESDEFPFIRKRTFSYSGGLFTGYVDSTFIDEEFITKISTVIYYDKKQLPVHVEHIKTHTQGDQFFKKREQFEYTYFQKEN